VRPEKLRVEMDGNGGSSADLPRVEGTVTSSLYLGTATQIAVDLGEGVRMTVLVPNADEADRQRLPGGGARVALSWEPEHMHLVRESPNGAPAGSTDGASADDQSQKLETSQGG
jgi:ABC-type Fe3+/spermidine/putrescine transport system ATPase subunit